VEIVGLTKYEAYTAATQVSSVLSKELADAEVLPPRYKGQGAEGRHIFLIPTVIAKCPNRAKALIARLVLAGSL